MGSDYATFESEEGSASEGVIMGSYSKNGLRNYEDWGRGNDFSSSVQRCYESHQPLSLGSGLVVYGGSCGSPIVKDADVYVGLDLSMKKSEKAFPWVEGESFLYYIQDMHAPRDVESFTKLIDWLAMQLIAKKKVHIGCIGGHGRTGTVLSALVSVIMGEKNAIEYVRKNYCHKAVESHEQVEFLIKHFGVEKVLGAKEYVAPTILHHGGKNVSQVTPKRSTGGFMSDIYVPLDSRPSPEEGTLHIAPSKHKLSIWGD